MKKFLAPVLVLFLINLFAVPSPAQQKSAEDKRVNKIRKYIGRLKRWDVGDPVTLKLLNGTKVKGYIAEVADDHVVLTNRSGREPQSVNYSDVKDVNSGLGRKTKIALIATGAFLGLVATCVASKRCQD